MQLFYALLCKSHCKLPPNTIINNFSMKKMQSTRSEKDDKLQYELKYKSYYGFLLNAALFLDNFEQGLQKKNCERGIILEYKGSACRLPECFVPRLEETLIYIENAQFYVNEFALFSLIRFRSQLWVGIRSLNKSEAGRFKDVLEWIYASKNNYSKNSLKNSMPIMLLNSREIIGLTPYYGTVQNLYDFQQNNVNTLITELNITRTALTQSA